MSQVEFNEGQFDTSSIDVAEPNSKIINIFIKLSGGLIQTEKQARYAIFGFVGVAFLLASFLLTRTGVEQEPVEPVEGDIMYLPVKILERC